jgi:hypothetical protein
MSDHETLSPLTAEILRLHKLLEKTSPSAPGHPKQNFPGWHPKDVRRAYKELVDKGLLTEIPETLYRTTAKS